MKKVSVILPTYNVAQYLERCVNALVSQTYEEVEFLFVNDGSPDNCLEILVEYSNKYPQIDVVSKKNGGAADSRNFGLQHITGEYVMFADPDDWLENTAIADLVAILEQNDADVAIGRYTRNYEQKQSIIEKFYSFQRELKISETGNTLRENPAILIDIYQAPWGKIYKREIFNDEEVRFPVGCSCEDRIFTLNFLHKFGKMVFLDKSIYNYAVRPGSAMTAKDRQVFEMFEIMDMVLNYYRKNGIFDQFRDELEFLYIQYVLIGVSHRVLTSENIDSKEGIAAVLTICNERFPGYVHNRYLKKEPLFVRTFVKNISKRPNMMIRLTKPFV
ncbi:glycosyl transferase [Erysipelotrichaceae bacterium]|nr:glycosyl transferase [Erysipelotrichaceae bacterium]